MNDDGLEQSVRRRRQIRQKTIVPIEWYEERIARLIPSKRIGNEGRKANPKNAEERYEHPKIRPVVERTLSLWRSGEKILIFCFYRETAKALYEHIKRELERVTFQLVAEKLGLDPKREEQSLRRWLEGVTRRLANKKSPFHREIMAVLSAPLATDQFAILRPRSERLVEQLAAYVRSPSFIARYLPLELAEVREALSERVSSGEVARKGARALARALSEHRDASEITLERRIQEFLQFVKELAERSQYCAEEADAEAADPLDEYLGAIAVQTGGEGDEEVTSIVLCQQEGGAEAL